MVADWVEEEFRTADLGDKRVNQRLKRCVDQFAVIAESTPHACRSGADLKATYRFVSNARVDMSKVFSEHNRASLERASQEKLVYVIQDTTEVDLTKPQQQVVGAGPLRSDKTRGFYYHPAYAVSGEGVSLGVVDQVIWARDAESLKSSSKARESQRNKASFEEKESIRWLEMQQSAEQLARATPQTTFVCVADSEADIFELFSEAASFPDNFHLLIRGCHNRKITAASDSSSPIEASTLYDALASATVRYQTTIAVGGRDESQLPGDQKRARKQAKTARKAELAIRAISVTIAGPRRPGGGTLEDSKLNIVEAVEEQPPEGEPSVRWVLLTTLPINTNEEIESVLKGYRMRWSVETYFKTLKSGLKIEKMKYETLDRYLTAFAMLAAVAWRVEYIKTAARSSPESPCEDYFSSTEWKSIFAFVKRAVPDPSAPPTIAEFLLLIAQLGGYINKKSQGPPGSKTIWRGMAKFDTIVQAYQIFSDLRCGV